MAELAAVGLAASIVTFLDVSVRVVQRLAEYHATAKDAPSVFRQIETELPLINDILQRTKHECDAAIATRQSRSATPGDTPAAAGPKSGSTMAADAAARLAAVVASCRGSVERLETLLTKALPVPSDSRSRRTFKAFSSVWHEREIREVERQLAKSLQLLTLSFSKQSATMAMTASRADDLADPLMDGLFDVPSMRVAHMVRRPLLLETLGKLFGSSGGSSSDTAAPGGASDEPTVVVLLGLGGQGKTQLALEYCKMARASKQFDAIVWLDASSSDSAQRGFEQLASKIAPGRTFDDAEAKVSFVKDRLARMPKPWLMVFDNYDQPSDFPAITSYFPSPAGAAERGAILVTSRHAATERLGRVVNVAGMTEDEALELLLRQTKTEKNDSNIQAGQAIVRRLGYLPLAIDQAGAYISARKLPLDCFLQQFHERRAAVLQHTPSLWEYRRRLADGTDETPLSVFTTWELSFRHLPRNDTDRGHLRRFLAVAAHFDINGVYEAIFAAYCGSEAELRPKWMELFTSDGGEWDHEKFETAVAELSNLSLLHIVGATGAASFFSLHPLVADWVRLQARREERHSLALEAMGILRTYIDASDFTNMAYIGLARLLSQVDAYLRSGDDYLRSSDAWELAEVRDAAATLAHLYWHSGKVSQSQELYERVMTGCEKALGPDHTSTLVTVNNLGNLYRDQGKLAEAEEMLRRALFGREKALGPDHTSTLNTVHNLGVLYRDQGKLAEAEEMYRRALFGCEKALGPDHTSTLRTVRGLGTLYCNQGKQAQAEAMLSRAVNGLEMALGPDHKSTINALYELGRLYVRQGRHDDGRPLLERAQAGSEKVYGPNHRYTRAAVALLEECLRQPRQPGESATARHARRFCLGFLRT